MQISENQGSDIYAIQTLYDGKWVCARKFINEDQAQIYAALLVPDWGKARVRLLLGKYDVEEDRRHYSELDMVPPKSRFSKLMQKLGVNGRMFAQEARKRIVTSVVMAVFGIGLSLIAFSALTSYPTLASNDTGNRSADNIASAKVSIARSIQDIFSDISTSKYAQTKTLPEVPLRMRGDWSHHCASGTQDLQISVNTLTEFDGAIANDHELQIVFQSGQTYGLVTREGQTRILEMITVDEIKIIGQLSEEGQFTISKVDRPLQRCM